MSLRTDYKDDIFEGSRLWRLNQNEDGTYTITDVTNYTQKGDKFGQNDVNAITGAINGLDASVTGIITVALLAAGWTTDASGLYKQTVAVERITAEDMPLLLKYTAPDTSKDDGTDYGIDFGMLSGGQCAAGSVTFYATDVLAHDITVCLALGKKGDGRLLLGGGGSPEKSEISNVVITITDNAAIAEGGAVTATCNGKSWSSTIKNGKAKLYASEVGNYTITVVTTDAEPVTYTTMLVCPYFGQFSTDIYSGTLVVTCTEEGGNGKTCNVRSCDDEYNPTDAYNLTQTFDTALELTFLGIPSGKYLVTVDDKYVFFKQIETIQNINSVQVELKQWLYKNGDQCLHNTGGWMKCAIKQDVSTISKQNGSSTGVANANVVFNSSNISFICNGYSNAVRAAAFDSYYGIRGATYATTTLGTVKALREDIKDYKTLNVTGKSSQLIAAFRIGAANSGSVRVNTATVLGSGSPPLNLNIGSNHPYLVLGCTVGYESVDWYGDTPSSVSYNANCSITEVWLK